MIAMLCFGATLHASGVVGHEQVTMTYAGDHLDGKGKPQRAPQRLLPCPVNIYVEGNLLSIVTNDHSMASSLEYVVANSDGDTVASGILPLNTNGEISLATSDSYTIQVVVDGHKYKGCFSVDE